MVSEQISIMFIYFWNNFYFFGQFLVWLSIFVFPLTSFTFSVQTVIVIDRISDFIEFLAFDAFSLFFSFFFLFVFFFPSFFSLGLSFCIFVCWISLFSKVFFLFMLSYLTDFDSQRILHLALWPVGMQPAAAFKWAVKVFVFVIWNMSFKWVLKNMKLVSLQLPYIGCLFHYWQVKISHDVKLYLFYFYVDSSESLRLFCNLKIPLQKRMAQLHFSWKFLRVKWNRILQCIFSGVSCISLKNIGIR